MKRFKLVSLHFTNECNLECPHCYKARGGSTMDRDLLLELPKYLSKITDQVAVGGGEPLMKPYLLRDFAWECSKHNLICNVTSNGTLMDSLSDDALEYILHNIRMVSLSIDEWKVKDIDDLKAYFNRVKRLNSLCIEVGSNLLIDKVMFREKVFIHLVSHLFKSGVSRVFALHPKNYHLGVDILDHRDWYMALTTLYKHFYVDDLTHKILTEGYDWETPCHYAKDMISIDLDG